MPTSAELNEKVEYLAIGLILFMSVVNLGVMVKLSIGKLILKCKQRAAQKTMKAEMAKKMKEKID